jgi:hypothetical protein
MERTSITYLSSRIALVLLFGLFAFISVAQPIVSDKVIARNHGNLALGDLGGGCESGDCGNVEQCLWVAVQYGYACEFNDDCSQVPDLADQSSVDYGAITFLGSALPGTYTYEIMRELEFAEPDFGEFGNCGTRTTVTKTSDFDITVVDWRWTGSIPAYCVGQTATIDLRDIFTGESDAGGSTTFSGPGVTGQNYRPQDAGQGTHTIVATRSFSNGVKTTSITAVVNGLPSVSFNDPTAFCESQSDPDLRDWVTTDKSGSFSESEENLILRGTNNRYVDISQSTPGTYTVLYTYTDGNGCSNNDAATININTQNTVNAGTDQEWCEDTGNKALESVTDGVTWTCVTASCTYISGSEFNTDDAPPGDYIVRATKTVGACTATDDKTVTITEKPVVDAGNDLTVCVDDAAFELTGQSPTTGVWTSNCEDCLAGSRFSPENAGIGTHTITFTHTSAAGCENSDTRTITVIGLPDASNIVTNSPVRCGDGDVDFTASLAGHTIHWYTGSSGGDAFHIANSLSDHNIPVGTTTYYLEAKNSNGCFSATRKAISGVAYGIPSNPTAGHGSSCGSGTIELSASGSGNGVTYRWYAGQTGESISTGVTFTTPTLTSTRDYYVDALSGDGCNSGRTKVTATINTVPGAPTLFHGSSCGQGEVQLSVGGAPEGGSYRWYTASEGGTSFNSTDSYKPTLSETTSFYVSIVSAEGCEGLRGVVTATIFPAPGAPVRQNGERCGQGPVTISANADGAVQYNWYETAASEVSVYEGQQYSPELSTNTSYWVGYTDGNGCKSPRTEVFATINPIPANPTVTEGGSCGTGTVELGASGSGEGAAYDWFENPQGGSSLHTGNSFETPELSVSRSYYVEATSVDGCKSVGRTEVVAQVNSFPGLPNVSDNGRCGPGDVILSASGAPAGGGYRWYTASEGGSPFNETDKYTANIASSEGYFVSIVSEFGCEGSRQEVVATINEIPSAPLVNDAERCGPGTVDLSASHASSGNFKWYETEPSETIIFTGGGYTTPSLNITTSYWVEFVSPELCVSTRSEVIATVNTIPDPPVAPSVENCGPGIVNLNASGAVAGSIYEWFENSSGGSTVHTGPTFQPQVGITRNYFVEVTTPDNCTSQSRTQATVTINPVPDGPLVFDTETCGPGIVTFTVAGASAGGSYRWYESATDGTSFNSTDEFDETITNTTSYFVSIVTPESCEGPREMIEATVNDIPPPPTGNDGEICGPGTVVLSVSSQVTGIFNWYETEFSAVSLFTGVNFNTPVISGTTTYWVDITDGNGCVSERTQVTATVNPIPNDPVSSNEDRCGPGDVTMEAYGSGEGAVYNWYSNPGGGVPMHTGESYNVNVTSSRNYYVSATSSDGCVSGNRTEVQVTINTIPGVPIVNDGSSCGPGNVALTVGGAPAGGAYRWYTASAGGTSFNSSNSFTPNLSTTTSYWASVVSAEGCEGERDEIVATVHELPLAPIGIDGDRCGPGPVSLSANSGVGVTFNWYDTQASAVSIFAGTNFTTPVLGATRTYWVELTDGNGCISPRTEVTATIFDIPDDPIANNVDRCGFGNVTMNASGGGDGATYQWFTSSVGGSPVFIGSGYTATISSTTNFYVGITSVDGCVTDNRTQVVATVNSIPGAPSVFNGNSCGAGDVLLTVGGAPVGGSYRWYNTETGGVSFNTSNSFLASISQTTSYWVSSVSAENCEGPRAEITATIYDVLPTPSGVDGNRCGPGSVPLSVNSGISGTFNWYETEFSAVSVSTSANFNTPFISATQSYWVNITNSNGCVSPRTEVTATVFPIPVDPISSDVGRCGPGEVTMSASGSVDGATYEWFSNATGGAPLFVGDNYTTNVTTSRTFYVAAVSTEGCDSDNRGEVQVSIFAVPGVPILNDNDVCGQGDVSLTVAGAPAGGGYRWYTASEGGTSFNSSNSFTPNVSETTSYWVSIISENGCEGMRGEITATVNDIPLAPIGINGDRCGPGTVALAANAGVSGSFDWYDTHASAVSLFRGVNFNTPVVSETRSYYVSLTDVNGCVSARSEVVATINDIPSEPVVNNIERCGPGDVTMNASGSGAGATYDWFRSLAGGSSISSGPEFTTSVSRSESFYVGATSSEGCVTNSRSQIVVAIASIPSTPIPLNGEHCGPGEVTTNVIGAPAGGSYKWYLAESGGVEFNNGNSYTAELTETATFWVSIVTANGCEGDRAQAQSIIHDLPLAPIGTNGDRCGPGPVVVIVGSQITGSFNWYDTQSSSSSLFTGVNFTTPSITSNRSYWVDITDGNGCVSPRTEVIARIFDIPVDPVAPNVERCGEGVVTMNSSGSVEDAIYNWYDYSSGGIPIHTGQDYSPSVRFTRNYYVSAVSPQNCVSASRTPVTVTINAFPSEPLTFDGEVCGDGEVTLSAAGAPVGGSYRWYQGETSGTSFNSTSSWTGNFSTTTTYWVSIVTENGCEGQREPVTARVLALPSSPDGSDGERCGAGTVSIAASHGENGIFNWYETFSSNVSIASGQNFTTPSISSTTTYWVEFTNQNGCISERTSVTATVLDIISDPVVNNVERCGPGDVTIVASSTTQGVIFSWYENQFGGLPFFEGPSLTTFLSLSRNYYVGGTTAEGCNSLNRTPVTVTINPIPGNPSVNDGNVCGPGEVSLTALGAPEGGGYNWYDSNLSSTVISTGAEFTTSIDASRSYFVSIVNQYGCEGERTEVLANVNEFPSSPTGEDGERCGTGDVDISATTTIEGASINWYIASSGGSPFASGQDITIDNLDGTTTYYAATISAEGCESPRIPVVATINPIEEADIGENFELCHNAGAYDLADDLVDVGPDDGYFVGPGVIGTEIHPNIAGLGNKEVTFVLEETIGCLTNGKRYITIIDIREDGTSLELSEDFINQCINAGSVDLNELPNIKGGSWEITAKDESLNLGIFDPAVAGVGEYVATYSVQINGCTVQKSIDINVTDAPSSPTIDGPFRACKNEKLTLSVEDPEQLTYYWFKNDDATSFASGESVEVLITEDVSYSLQSKNVYGCRSNVPRINIEAVEVIVEFSASPLAIDEGDRVEFLTNVEGSDYFWEFGDGLTSTEQNPSHLYFTEGSYTVTLTIKNSLGCEGALTKEGYVKVDKKATELVTGIDDQLGYEAAIVYPQPFTSAFNVDIHTPLRKEVKVYIFMLNGELVHQRSIILSAGDNSIRFDLDNLKSGVYIMRLIGTDGSSFDKRIIKAE